MLHFYLDSIAEKGICIDLESLREQLEFAGKECCIYESLLNYHEEAILKTQQEIEESRLCAYAAEKWLSILQTQREIFEMID